MSEGTVGTYNLTSAQRKELVRTLKASGLVTLVPVDPQKNGAFYVLAGVPPVVDINGFPERARRIGYLGNNLRLDELGAYLRENESIERDGRELLVSSLTQVKSICDNITRFYRPQPKS